MDGCGYKGRRCFKNYSVVQPVWYGSANPTVTGLTPVSIIDENVKTSGPGFDCIITVVSGSDIPHFKYV